LSNSNTKLHEILKSREKEIAADWIESQEASGRRMTPNERQEHARQSREFLGSLTTAIQKGDHSDIAGPAWEPVRDLLTDFSGSRAKGGYSPSETASYIFSLKQPVFSALRKEFERDPAVLHDEVWRATVLLDKLGLFTTEAFQKTREDVISRQQSEILELATPVVRLWDNILALPLIGTLDSSRTQVVMQNLLDAIVETRSDIAIIDITGVPVVDTMVAQHLLKTVAAARLMGADCLISGIRPQIAQTIIHLGVDLTAVTTKASLADAYALALKRTGHVVVQQDDRSQTAGR